MTELKEGKTSEHKYTIVLIVLIILKDQKETEEILFAWTDLFDNFSFFTLLQGTVIRTILDLVARGQKI